MRQAAVCMFYINTVFMQPAWERPAAGECEHVHISQIRTYIMHCVCVCVCLTSAGAGRAGRPTAPP